MPSGYEALRTSAAWLKLSNRGRIYATGGDSARLLHAMTTNHVQQLKPGMGCYAFFLNAQGHILADVNLLRLEDRFLLDTEPETRELVYRHLDKYIIADDVTLEDASETLTCLAVEGPGAAGILEAMGAPVPAEEYAHIAWNDDTIQRASSTGQTGFRIFGPRRNEANWIEHLKHVGVPEASLGDARTVRIEQGKPRYGEDIFDTTLPQETQQMDAVHFAKGCYLGQEIVERIRSRGHVNRLMIKAEVEGAEALRNEAKIEAESKECGEVTSSAFSPALGKTVALGYVRAPYAAAGTVLSIAGRAAMVC